MKTIFRKVSPEERLPTQTGRYHTNRGLTNYFHEALKYPPKGFEYSIDYWLEEIELPNDEEIKTQKWIACKNDDGINKPNWDGKEMDGFIKGAKWMRDFVLAVTAKDNVL